MSTLTDLIDEDFGFVESGDWGRSEKHDSLVVDIIRNLWYWNSKNERGNTEDYLVFVRKMSKGQAKAFISRMDGDFTSTVENVDKVKITTHKAVMDVMWKNGKNNSQYWDDRLLTKQTVNLFRLGYWNGFYSVPIFDNNKFINIQLRMDTPEKKIRWWYKGKSIRDVLFQSHILQYTDTVFIVEGIVDAILLRQHNIPAVAPTGGSGHWEDKWFQKFIRIKDIYIVQDNDEPGIMFGEKVADCLGTYRANRFTFGRMSKGYDSVDFFQDGGTPKEYVDTITGGI